MTRSYVLTTLDAEAWNVALPSDACVFGGLEYARIQERHSGQAARLFVTESDGARISYPFFLRPVPERFALDGTARWDTTTPEYTGPFILDPDATAASLIVEFRRAFERFCRSQGIIAEFAHLNPWHAWAELLDPACLEVNREIVYVDLSWGEETIWHQSLSSDTRRMTRQAIEAGVHARLAVSRQDVLAFHQLHQQTMERNSALAHYFLPPEYFLAIFETMARNAFFMLSEYQGRIVAGGLYFQDSSDIYWHLSAMDMNFSKVRPVNAYHYECIKSAMRTGKKRLLCGGSYRPGDGLFRFKAGFSPLRVPFRTYKRVHDPATYAALVKDWTQSHGGSPPDSGYFPAYRAVVPQDVPAMGGMPDAHSSHASIT